MRTPAGVSLFVRLPLKVSLLACVLPVAAFPAEEIRTVRPARVAPLPRYDPSIREKYLADQAANAAAPQPAAPPTTAAAPAPWPTPKRASPDDPVVLDPIVVYANRGVFKPPQSLPRLGAFAPLQDLPGEPFESGSARAARLVRKHFGSFGVALSRIPFYGGAIVGAALEAEAELKRAQDLNSIADSIELATLAGQDPEITRKTREEYLKLYYRGPQK